MLLKPLRKPTSGPVAEGSVGGGTGMRCYGFKAGIGTASRVLPPNWGGWKVGVLVNSNGGRRHQLRIDGVPVGKALEDDQLKPGRDGSFIIVIANGCPLDAPSVETVGYPCNTRTRPYRDTEYR